MAVSSARVAPATPPTHTTTKTFKQSSGVLYKCFMIDEQVYDAAELVLWTPGGGDDEDVWDDSELIEVCLQAWRGWGICRCQQV